MMSIADIQKPVAELTDLEHHAITKPRDILEDVGLILDEYIFHTKTRD